MRDSLATAFVLTFLDIYARTGDAIPYQAERVRTIINTLDFWILAGLQMVIAGTAAWVATAGAPQSWEVPAAIAAAVGSFGIVQTFSLKFGKQQIVDLRPFVETFKRTVETQVSSNKARTDDRDRQRLAKRLAEKYSQPKILDAYAEVHRIHSQVPAHLGPNPTAFHVAYFIAWRDLFYAQNMLGLGDKKIARSTAVGRWLLYAFFVLVAFGVVGWVAPRNNLWMGITWQTIGLVAVVLLGGFLPFFRHRLIRRNSP